MRRTVRLAVSGVLMAGVLSGLTGAASAGHAGSTLQVLAENPKARFDPKVQVLLIEERLARLQPTPVQVEYSTPYLQRVGDDRSVDVQIRRLGELIRRQEREQR